MRRALAVGLAVLAAVLLAGLGVWQLERREWKLALIAQVDARLNAPPVPAPSSASPGDAYTPVEAQGRWRPRADTYVQAVTDLGGGYWVLTPLDTAAGTILVNRGFVPAGQRGRVAVPSGQVRVGGLLRLTEPGGGFLRSNDPAHERWYSRDVAAIGAARHLGRIAPYFIDADSKTSPGWPRGGLTVVRFRNNHLMYAFTWFGLAGLAAWLAVLFARSKHPVG